ncbi:MAG TPA: HAD family hydrolase [Fimbriimonadaceae bacterium]|jgi:HAD superfamily hydrolase (TIGR01549 family)
MPKGLSLANFKAVLFDVDGTLVDTMPALVRGLGDAFEHFNGQRPSNGELLSIIGLPLRKQMHMFTDVPVSEAGLEERIEFAVDSFQRYVHLEQEFEAAIETLDLIRSNGYKTALVTSKSAIEISQLAQRVEWVRNVDTTVCASDVTHPKPDPESAFLACERLQVSPSDAVFIGDSVFDMRCAEQAGMKRVAVGYGSGIKEALLNENPDMYFDRPDDLLAWAKESIFRTPCLEGKT